MPTLERRQIDSYFSAARATAGLSHGLARCAELMKRDLTHDITEYVRPSDGGPCMLAAMLELITELNYAQAAAFDLAEQLAARAGLPPAPGSPPE